ncbi:hypothetical protein LSCM4_06095 [Leishmania orientalis]|uniref:Uncharacterized protein n=1 Tax=Leishmania orientalis TaxID=2249476 RepID=A0A836GUD0_9TRYP|nr:hypothetical protein LSCM4_06095 [Leishmania orientalis]
MGMQRPRITHSLFEEDSAVCDAHEGGGDVSSQIGRMQLALSGSARGEGEWEGRGVGGGGSRPRLLRVQNAFL